MMRKADIQLRPYLPYGGPPLVPVVNVKVDAFGLERHIPEVADDTGNAGFDDAWWDRNVDDDVLSWAFESACERGWELLQSDAEHIFGPHVKVYSRGRSEGWAYLDPHTVPDFDSWDAVMLAKWAKFCRIARDIADDVPYQMVWIIAVNVYERRMARESERIAASATLAV